MKLFKGNKVDSCFIDDPPLYQLSGYCSMLGGGWGCNWGGVGVASQGTTVQCLRGDGLALLLEDL